MRRPKNLGPQPLIVSLVFMITAGRFSSKENRQDHLGSGGIPQRRFCFLFPPWEKGSGRAFDFLFSKIAFFLRGRPAIPVFSGLACGPPPFLATRKGEKNRQGLCPLNPRVALSIFSL